MGNMPYFMSFKNGKKEQVYECLNEIGQERFLKNSVNVVDLITMKEDILQFKKGRTYVRTSGESYSQREKTFLDDVPTIRKNQCNVLNDELYFLIGGASKIKDYADIEDIEVKDGLFQPFKISESDKALKKIHNIDRIIGGYRISNYVCNSDDVDVNSEYINLIDTDVPGGYIYYDFNFKYVKDNETIKIMRLGSGYSEKLCVYATSKSEYGYMYFDKPEGFEMADTMENIKLATDSIARFFKEKGCKNITVEYVTNYSFDEFEEYKKEHDIDFNKNK